MTRALSCGVVVTDGARLLIGHATRSPRWDIPKGGAELGEEPEAAARRELLEETGLAAPARIEFVGRLAYMPQKDLALFVWTTSEMPALATLVCRSTFLIAGKPFPEFDRFDCPVWTKALPKLGKSMQAVLTTLARESGWI